MLNFLKLVDKVKKKWNSNKLKWEKQNLGRHKTEFGENKTNFIGLRFKGPANKPPYQNFLIPFYISLK